MPVTPLNLIKGDKISTNTDYRDALPVNMYGVVREILGAQGYMLCYPGLTEVATGTGKDRGGNYNDRFEKHLRVSGESLIEVGTDGTVTNLGTVTGSSQASMPYSFNSQCVIADGNMYLYTESGTFTTSDVGLSIGTTKTNVAYDAFTYTIDGVAYSKSADAVGVVPGNDVILQGKYGAVAFDIDTSGTVVAVEATNQSSEKFTSEAEAVAALPPPNDKCRMGYITVKRVYGDFIFGTTDLDQTFTITVYNNSAVRSVGFKQVTDPDLGNPIDGVWADHYYMLTDGEYIYHTDVNDESSIDPLKYATAEFMPDKTLGVSKTQDNIVIYWGRYSVESFDNVASDDFAWSRIERRAQKIGIVATHAKCEAGGKFYITGGRKEQSVGVHIVGIGSSEKISSREVDKILAEYTEPELSEMRMESRMDGDVTFVIIHLPNETLCFNETVAKKFGIDVAWSILKSDVNGDTVYRGINGIFEANRGQWIYGDKQNSNIGMLDNTVFTQYGTMVEFILYTPLVMLDRQSVDELEIETIPGHTTSKDATVALSLTYDGLTYGKEWFVMYGEPLDYGNRFIIRRLSIVNDYIGFKLRGATTSRMAFSMARVTHG